MKKIISICLTILLLCGSLSISAAASVSKIAPAVAEEMEDLDEGETMTVAVWTVIPGNFKDSIELTEYVNQKTYEECGLTPGDCTTQDQVDIYSKTYNRIMFELERANVPVVIEKLRLGYEDIIGKACNMLMAYLTKDQIAAAAQMDEVRYIERYEVRDPGEPTMDEPNEGDTVDHLDPDYGKVMTESDFVEAIKRAYGDPAVTDGMIHVERFESVADSVYVIRFTVDGEEYDENGAYRIGAFTLNMTDNRQPLIYCTWEHTFRTLASAYESKIIGHAALKNIAALDWVDLTRTVWLPGDTDDDFSITILDATYIQRDLAHLLDWELTADADADGDGSITILDATHIQRCLAGLCEIAPIELPTRLADGIYVDEHSHTMCQVIDGFRFEIEDPAE